MKKLTSIIANFFKGLASYAAILPSFFTSYPYSHEDKSLTNDWYNIGEDINQAIAKYDKEGK